MQVSFKHQERYPFLLELLPSFLQRELHFLKNFFASYTQRVYMVGGSVRDLIRLSLRQDEVRVVDLDLEVYGIEPKLFEELMAKLGAKGVGKSFFVYKYKEHIDIALPRVEKKVAKGHQGFRVFLAKEEREASKRRDFCMNALMLSIFDGMLIDFWGGIEDIQKKRIRIIDEVKFQEDSLRVLRGVQFSSRFGYKIEKSSCDIMQRVALDDLSCERIFWEFEKLFRAKFLHFGLFYLLSLRIVQKIFSLTLDRRFFFQSALEMARNRDKFEEKLYKFYFLYIFAKNQHRRFNYFLDILKAPNDYYRAFREQKYLPKRRTDRFLAALALRYPLSQWLGNYKEDVKIRAKEFSFWEKRFIPIQPKTLLEEGFRGRELGEELKKRSLQIIKQRFSSE